MNERGYSRLEYENKREALRRRRRNRIMQQLAGSAVKILAVFLAGFIVGSLVTGNRIRKEQEVSRSQTGATVSDKVISAGEDERVQSAPVSWVVVIDAGHGGIDPGSLESKPYEKDINLDMAQKLQDILEEKGVRVIMTRTGDESLSLADRSNTANHANADLLISIHQNSYDSSDVSGIEFFYNPYKDEGGDESEELAQMLKAAVSADSSMKVRGIIANDDLKVLRTTKTAAVLIEAGYLTNPSELNKLLSDSYQEKLMGYVADGIMEYLEEYC